MSDKDEEDPFAFFDPRVSPHLYPGGIPIPTKSSDETTTSNNGNAASSLNIKSDQSPSPVSSRIGVLLIDHGSKREAANLHLETLAKTYQKSTPPHYVVRAAHMELSSPSISEGLQDLILNQKVDRVVCHPYFLSPGRHATEDVPQLIKEAIHELGEDAKGVDVVTTNPIGANMDVMVGAIGSVIDQSVKSSFKNRKDGFGFFADIQKQLLEGS